MPRVGELIGLLVCLFLVVGNVQATTTGTTGILKGRVTDLSTGETLPGVNIFIVGSGRGGFTNDRGEYLIPDIIPGTYTIRVSLVGYQTIEAKRVEIEVDQTSVYDFKLAGTAIEMEGVTTEGQRPLVDVTKTAGDQTFSREKIEQLPNVKGVQDVLGLQAGVVKFGGQLFLRGGRANETQILVDGVPVNDVSGITGTAGTSTANQQLQQLYSGNTTAGASGALSVSANAIQSVSVSSSGLDAEFGNAQSGVVSITTKSGGDTYSGSLQYRTDAVTRAGFGERYYTASLGGPEPLTAHLLPALGIEVPGKLTFFMSSTFSQSDGPYGFSTSSFYDPVKRKVKFTGFLGQLLNDLGFTYSEKQSNEFTFNGKLSYDAGENDQFALSYRANAKTKRGLSGAYDWRDLADSTSSTASLISQQVLQWTHILATNSILRGYLSRIETERTTSVGTLNPLQYSTLGNTGNFDVNRDGFNDLGNDQGWSTSNTVVWNAKFDYNGQIHPLHFLKGGFEYYYEHLQSTSIAFPLSKAKDTLDARGEYPGFGLGRWVSNNLPSRGALYVQDNIDFPGINIHIGLRYDFFYLGRQVYDPEFVKRYEAVINDRDTLTPYVSADWLDHQSFFSQFVRGNFSPRLSIGYPVSERTVFYFNYGHFLQYPERNQYFHDPFFSEGDKISGNYVGNPALKPQRTIQYEAGFDQLLFEDFSIGVRGFYKDIFDYATLRRLKLDRTVDQFVNLDYGSVRGFEVILTKAATDRFSGSMTYTFQVAKGRSSDPRAAQASPQLFGLPRETRLDFDQQHTANLFVGYRVGPYEDFRLLGLPLNNWGVSLTWNFGSGFPYTPYNLSATLEDLYLKNAGDGPYTSEINFSMFKGFEVVGKLDVVFTLDVVNLFNRKNVDLNGGGFNSLFGRPVLFGDYDAQSKYIYQWQSFASLVPPFVFRGPRQISLGMKVNWN
jgi:outer membrane receptor for ferrienterochelin and colicin